MIRGLLILNSAYSGARDLWWPLVHHATRGYNVYRSSDAPYNWVKINGPSPVPGQFYRDQSQLEQVKYAVQPTDWNDQGVMGMQTFQIPDTPYSSVIQGKPRVAFSPDDVQVQVTFLDGTVSTVRPGLVSGIDQTIYLSVGGALPNGGAVTNLPIINFADAVSYVAIYNKLINYVDISANMFRTYYTVVPVGDHGELHLPGAFGTEIVNSMEVDRMDYMQREMVRRNQWIFEQVGEPAYLMFRRRAGEPCGCTTTDTGHPRTRCPVCFEVGIVGGYYGPYDFLFIDPDQATVRTIDEGGIKVERASRSFLGPTPIIQDGDLIIRRNGERLAISTVTYKMPRGVLLQQDFDVELLNPGDTRYLIPVPMPQPPVIYNPTVAPDPDNGVGGAEPIFETTTVPGKLWNNPDPQVGRTITFGRIQT